ncbi:HAMP domain-containing histidine kinase [Actinomadura sp. KC345]|uniref:sensor histidine kinase n=1 Tax=Actinomadura sp. KC345 TaxID=2530371 RepID=UPI001044EF06|nr:HAMP domain-containing sensor histidine kinase [Actinomadura sp. KC345]TDC56054.1 HAMP domain-containing histidine kinase [Actinomadura sp. KC345]
MKGITERLRPTIRMRLTLLYTGLFLGAGVFLLGLTYILVQGNLERQSDPVDATNALETGGTVVAPSQPAMEPPELSVKRVEGALVQAREESRRETLAALLTQGGIALGVVAAAGLGFGWLLADRALRPVHTITETAGRVARSHDLTERIAYEGPRDDVKELADAFDTMLARLARAFDGQRRFAANASHELRTPLAINRTLVDVAVRRPDATDDVKRLGESLLVVNGRHERLIDGLLTLAGTENVVTGAGPLDLADVAAHVLDQAAAEAEARGVVSVRALDPAATSGDPVLIERLVQNLVENAIRHNHDGGDLAVATGERDGRAEVVVTNTGPVVPAYEVETIFEPFRRLGNDRVRSDRGSGLGLSIVRATATAHGGTVTAAPRPGGGLVVTVRLPVPEPASRRGAEKDAAQDAAARESASAAGG